MSALPGQTIESYEDTLSKVLALEPEHISAYSLILEEGTVFYDWYEKGKLDRGAWKLPSEEEEYAMGELTILRLAEAGMHRYEIFEIGKHILKRLEMASRFLLTEKFFPWNRRWKSSCIWGFEK